MAHRTIASWLRAAARSRGRSGGARDPGQLALDHPPAGRTSKVCTSRLRTISSRIFSVVAQVASLRAEYPEPAQASRIRVQQRARFHSSGRAPSRSWTLAAVITTASSSPAVSTAMCRLRPLT